MLIIYLYSAVPILSIFFLPKMMMSLLYIKYDCRSNVLLEKWQISYRDYYNWAKSFSTKAHTLCHTSVFILCTVWLMQFGRFYYRSLRTYILVQNLLRYRFGSLRNFAKQDTDVSTFIIFIYGHVIIVQTSP